MGEPKFSKGKFSRLGRGPHLTAAVIIVVVGAAFSPAIAQTQYSIGNPTNEQQYMLELINRARANGGAEAARLGLSGLQEGPPSINGEPWTIQNSVHRFPGIRSCLLARKITRLS